MMVSGRRLGEMLALSVIPPLLLSGCGSSTEDHVYEAFKCAKVATLLEQEEHAEAAMNSALPYMQELEEEGDNPGRLVLQMNQRFQDDVPLYRTTIDGQMVLLYRVYKSNDCQSLYKPAGGSG
ncbi:hypothetical protein [Luteimonas huabeiensis]|uniref:hypothetical protein n=1 Tax=Luteimonas huabeiensis TaxID=1244513 RepID=UPI001F1D0CFB|nr:hypothetical protein [Luteimonas huabeiensis]